MNIKEILFILLISIPSLISGQESICPDVEGYKEHIILKKYKNSCVIGFNEIKYESVSLPIEQQSSGRDSKQLTVEGKITDVLFGIENTNKATVLEVQRNYETALRKSDMKILYACNGKDKCFKYGNGNFIRKNKSMGDVKYLQGWDNQKLKYFRFAMSSHNSNLDNDESYFIAQGKKNNKKYTIALLIRYNRTSWEGLNGNIFIFAKIIEEDVMDTDQVSIEAIDEKIKNEGKKIFNNIHFDLGSAQLKKESNLIIATISEYLKENPTQKYYIVGHTDNVGSLISNQKLSDDRAASVRSALINNHNISMDQITSHGVGQLSPVAANDTEEGRTLNRRVEIVLQ